MCHIHDKLTSLMNWAQHGTSADMFLIFKAYTSAVTSLLNFRSYSKCHRLILIASAACLLHTASHKHLTVVYKLWLIGHSMPYSSASLSWYCRSGSKIMPHCFFFKLEISLVGVFPWKYEKCTVESLKTIP
jgi:hypothetical protein